MKQCLLDLRTHIYLMYVYISYVYRLDEAVSTRPAYTHISYVYIYIICIQVR